MTKKHLKLAKNACWVLAGVSMFFILLGNTKNNQLTIVAFVFIILGIVANYPEEKK